MLVKINGQRVDVLEPACSKRECFSVGYDRGPYSQGRGYTNTPKNPKAVCGRRMHHGCPTNSVCPICRRSHIATPGAPCEHKTTERNPNPGRPQFVTVSCPGVTVAAEAPELKQG